MYTVSKTHLNIKKPFKSKKNTFPYSGSLQNIRPNNKIIVLLTVLDDM